MVSYRMPSGRTASIVLKRRKKRFTRFIAAVVGIQAIAWGLLGWTVFI